MPFIFAVDDGSGGMIPLVFLSCVVDNCSSCIALLLLLTLSIRTVCSDCILITDLTGAGSGWEEALPMSVSASPSSCFLFVVMVALLVFMLFWMEAFGESA